MTHFQFTLASSSLHTHSPATHTLISLSESVRSAPSQLTVRDRPEASSPALSTVGRTVNRSVTPPAIEVPFTQVALHHTARPLGLRIRSKGGVL
eukprot:3031827-Prymnesium_polylepis.2